MFYHNEGEWHPLPVWANFFLELGAFAAVQPLQPERSVIAVSVPTRAFAAAFAAVGVIKKNLGARTNRTSSEHFEFLSNLPLGTSVKCVEKGKQKTYLLRGTRQFGDEVRLVIQMSGKRDGNAQRFISEKFCTEIQPLENGNFAAPTLDDLPKRQKGKRIHEVSDFGRKFLSIAAETSFSLETTLNCLLIGRRNILHEEIYNTNFSIPSQNIYQEAGVLQDVLRVRQFYPTEQPSNCEFLPSDARSKSLKKNLRADAPIAVFDGANGFLKLRDHLRRSHWIALLDRTETNYSAAIEQLNADFINRESDEIPVSFPNLPPGLEAMFYTEKLR